MWGLGGVSQISGRFSPPNGAIKIAGNQPLYFFYNQIRPQQLDHCCSSVVFCIFFINRPISMTRKLRPLLTSVCRTRTTIVGKPVTCQSKRWFTNSPRRTTDGVYRELTAMRIRTPFIEAFRKQQDQQEQGEASDTGSKPAAKPDLAPKSMKDSYHRVVSHNIKHE